MVTPKKPPKGTLLKYYQDTLIDTFAKQIDEDFTQGTVEEKAYQSFESYKQKVEKALPGVKYSTQSGSPQQKLKQKLGSIASEQLNVYVLSDWIKKVRNHALEQVFDKLNDKSYAWVSGWAAVAFVLSDEDLIGLMGKADWYGAAITKVQNQWVLNPQGRECYHHVTTDFESIPIDQYSTEVAAYYKDHYKKPPTPQLIAEPVKGSLDDDFK